MWSYYLKFPAKCLYCLLFKLKHQIKFAMPGDPLPYYWQYVGTCFRNLHYSSVHSVEDECMHAVQYCICYYLLT